MKNRTLWIILAIVALVLISGVSMYNGMVSTNEAIDSKWSQVENQLQRRSDLIPNLVATRLGIRSERRCN